MVLSRGAAELNVSVMCVRMSWCEFVYLHTHTHPWGWRSPLVWPSTLTGHTLFWRMQTPRLMDGRSGCFPGFSVTWEIVIQPLEEASGQTGSSFAAPRRFSDGSRMLWRRWEHRCFGWAVCRGGVKLRPPAVLSPELTGSYNSEDCYHIWWNQTHRFVLFRYLHILTTETLTLRHRWCDKWIVKEVNALSIAFSPLLLLSTGFDFWSLLVVEVELPYLFSSFQCFGRVLQQKSRKHVFHVRRLKKPLSYTNTLILTATGYSHIPKMWENCISCSK